MKEIRTALPRLWRWTRRLWRKPKGERSTQFAWLVYIAVDDYERVRIYNTTDKPVDTEISLRRKVFRLVNVGEQVLGYKPKAGDHFFRLVTPEERDGLAEIRLKALQQNNRRQGMRTINTAKLRAQLRQEYANQLIVVHQGGGKR